jgi:hypothetical protein
MKLEIESTPELAAFLAEHLPEIQEKKWDDVRELGVYPSRDGFGADGDDPGIVQVRLEKALVFGGAFQVFRILVVAEKQKWPPSGTVHIFQAEAEEEAQRLIAGEQEKNLRRYLCQWSPELWNRIPAAARALNGGGERRYDCTNYWGGFARVFLETQTDNGPSFWPPVWRGFSAGYLAYDSLGIFVAPFLGGYLATRPELTPDEMGELQAWLGREANVLIMLARQLPHEGPPDMPGHIPSEAELEDYRREAIMQRDEARAERANYWGMV